MSSVYCWVMFVHAFGLERTKLGFRFCCNACASILQHKTRPGWNGKWSTGTHNTFGCYTFIEYYRTSYCLKINQALQHVRSRYISSSLVSQRNIFFSSMLHYLLDTNDIFLQNILFQKIKTIFKMNQKILPGHSASKGTQILIMAPLNSRGIFQDSTDWKFI